MSREMYRPPGRRALGVVDTRVVDEHRKRLVLVACIMGSAVVTVDSTVVNVALPAIRDDLGGGFAGQQWTANAYLVTLASLILIGGSLGDIFGERRVFAFGVAAFGADLDRVCASPPPSRCWCWAGRSRVWRARCSPRPRWR